MRRSLRLASGLVLFTYITAHLVNHALGLVSLKTAEAGARIRGRGLVEPARHRAAVRRVRDPFRARAVVGVRAAHLPPAAARAAAHRARLHPADPADRTRRQHQAGVGAVRDAVGLRAGGGHALVHGLAGHAARRDGAGLGARLPRAAFPAQPPAALSQAALRAVRLRAAASRCFRRWDSSPWRGSSRPAPPRPPP